MNGLVFRLPGQRVRAQFGSRESVDRDAAWLFWHHGASFAATVVGDGRSVERIQERSRMSWVVLEKYYYGAPGERGYKTIVGRLEDRPFSGSAVVGTRDTREEAEQLLARRILAQAGVLG